MKLTADIINQNKKFLVAMTEAIKKHMNLMHWNSEIEACVFGEGEASFGIDYKGDLVVEGVYVDSYDNSDSIVITIDELLSVDVRLEEYYEEKKKEEARKKAREAAARARNARIKKEKEEAAARTQAEKDMELFNNLKKQYGWK